METWKDIPDTDYSVSDQGGVASRKRGGWRVLKSQRDKDGYITAALYADDCKALRK